MIRLRAKVSFQACVTSGLPADCSNNQLNRAPKIPIPDSIEIEGGHEGGYLLIHVYLREGPFIHTWHSTLQEAKDEAKQDFSIQEDEWEPVAEEES